MKFCEECGVQLEDDAIFCEECGATVGDSESIPVVTNPEPTTKSIQESASVKKTKKISKLPIIVGSIVVVCILAVVIGAVCILGRNEDKNGDSMTVDKEIEEIEENRIVQKKIEVSKDTVLKENSQKVNGGKFFLIEISIQHFFLLFQTVFVNKIRTFC